MTQFNEKKEHDLSGRKGPVRNKKPASNERKTKPKEEKVNGSNGEAKPSTPENGVEIENGEKEETPEA